MQFKRFNAIHFDMLIELDNTILSQNMPYKSLILIDIDKLFIFLLRRYRILFKFESSMTIKSNQIAEPKTKLNFYIAVFAQ